MKPVPPNRSSSVYERYELKFAIPLGMVETICDFCTIYCRPDPYSETSATGFYTVNSLYLDTPNYLFLHKRLDGSENRFNMRVRTYGETTMPCFLEIKQKQVDIVFKYRARTTDEYWYRMFEDPEYRVKGKDISEGKSKTDLFYRVAYTYNVGPVVLTRYQRRAYESVVDDYARITFDKNMKCQPANGFALIPNEEQLIPYDNSTVFEPECNVVMELKCYSAKVPYWMIDMIRSFNLQRRSFSKYVFSITEVLAQFKYDTSCRQTSIRENT
jgi:hypothetical protein